VLQVQHASEDGASTITIRSDSTMLAWVVRQ
jgi:hypothetical protein